VAPIRLTVQLVLRQVVHRILEPVADVLELQDGIREPFALAVLLGKRDAKVADAIVRKVLSTALLQS
jgi:hypothetical protein